MTDRDLVKSFVWMYPKYVTAVEVFNILWDLSLASKEQSHNVMCFMQIWIEVFFFLFLFLFFLFSFFFFLFSFSFKIIKT